MSWCNCLVTCLNWCCQACTTTRETDSFLSDRVPSSYTVRRISSFGQTIVNEHGEERELGRHSSIITYNGDSVPWSSKPAPIQPGVTHTEILNHIQKMPTITESPIRNKPKRRWKKEKIEVSRNTLPTGLDKSVRLAHFRNTTGSTNLFETTSKSQDDIFDKCKKTISKENIPSSNYLMVQSMMAKSLSSPDLVQEATNTNKMSNAANPLSLLTERKIEKSDNLKSDSEIGRTQTQSTESERIAKLYGLDLSLYTEEALNPLNICSKNISTPQIQTWIEEPVGVLNITMYYDCLHKILTVNVNALESLCGKGREKEPFPTIIKLMLLGNKKSTKTSKKIDRSLNPLVKQTFVFPLRETDSKALRLSVYNADWLGKHDVIGHSLFPIEEGLDPVNNYRLKLFSQSTMNTNIGKMQIGLAYDGAFLKATIEKIFNFDNKMRFYKLYLKVAYYSISKKVKEKISPIAWAESECNEIVFNYSASIKVDSSGLKHSYIVVTLKQTINHAIFKSDKTIGRIIFGPYFYSEGGKNLTPWGRLILNKEPLHYAFKMVL